MADGFPVSSTATSSTAATTNNSSATAATANDNRTATASSDATAAVVDGFPVNSTATDDTTTDDTATNDTATNDTTARNSRVADGYPVSILIIEMHMRRQILAILGLVERTVKARNEEHKYLSTHTKEQPEVGSRQVGQLEQGTCNHDGSTPAVCVVHERLSRNAVKPFLQTIDRIEFTVFSHRAYLLFDDFTI